MSFTIYLFDRNVMSVVYSYVSFRVNASLVSDPVYPQTELLYEYDQRTYGLTWVGARDTCVSKNYGIFVFKIVFRQFSFELRIGAW